MLALVVLVAVVLVLSLEPRRSYCRQRITFHSFQELVFQRRILEYQWGIEKAVEADQAVPPQNLKAIAEYKPLMSYHRSQVLRYQRAMWFPFVSLTPDIRSTVSQDELSDPAWEKRYEEEYQRVKRLKQRIKETLRTHPTDTPKP